MGFSAAYLEGNDAVVAQRVRYLGVVAEALLPKNARVHLRNAWQMVQTTFTEVAPGRHQCHTTPSTYQAHPPNTVPNPHAIRMMRARSNTRIWNATDLANGVDNVCLLLLWERRLWPAAAWSHDTTTSVPVIE